MEVTECTRIIHDRINQFDPENAIKIIGYLLLTCKPDELTQLALGTDKLIFSVATEAQASLGSSPNPNFSFPLSFQVRSPDVSHAYYNPLGIYRNQSDLTSQDENPVGPDFLSSYYYRNAQLGGGSGSRLRSPGALPGYSSKPCHYFYRGHCRHGISCRYSHADAVTYNQNLTDLVNDGHEILPGSLDELEIEISELLKERNGIPLSIASLPMMYIDKYGKALQCDGYFIESQRHGKSGYGLTDLLARLRSVRIIDRRRYGQHSLILAEDAPKYMARSDSGVVLSCSHQIYLTFPAESEFTDEDVSNYFKQFGPVRDVRIPRQEKRMFGFVSFIFPETVRLILDTSHPHIISGSRVLVKPYKEKTKFYDRKYPEKMELPMYYPSQGFELEPEFITVPALYDNAILQNKHLTTEHERAIENERTRLLQMPLASKPLSPHHFSSFGIENLNISEDNMTTFPVSQKDSSSIDNKTWTRNNCNDHESVPVELPDSPFASTGLSDQGMLTFTPSYRERR